MTNEEMLAQIAVLIQKQAEQYENLLVERTSRFESLLDERTGRFENLLDERTNRFESLLDDHTLQINLKIENEVSKRLDSLFDGYMLTHDKQWELERKVKSLEERIEKLENIAS